MKMKNTALTWADVENLSLDIIRQMSRSRWQPSYVVGIIGGGLMPATLISQWFNCPLYSLDRNETNAWMAEDAYGHNTEAKNILIVNDINASGMTFQSIVDDWQDGCFPVDETWNNVWNKNVRFAALYDKSTSAFKNVDYSAIEVSLEEVDNWIDFPWDLWWRK